MDLCFVVENVTFVVVLFCGHGLMVNICGYGYINKWKI